MGTPFTNTSDFVDRLMSTTHEIILLVDREGRIVSGNAHLSELSGYTLDELHGRDLLQLFPSERQPHARELFQVGNTELEVRAAIEPIVVKSGARKQVEWRANTVYDDDGQVLGLLCVGQDVTELCELQAKLAEHDRLTNIGTMMARFIHDIGNPLNSISLQLQLLQRRAERPDCGPLGPKLDALLGEVRRMTDMLDEFRSYQDPSKLQLEPTDIGGVVRDVSRVLTASASERSVEFECEVSEQLPRVLSSPSKLRQVLISLCSDHMDAMPEGGKLRLLVHPENDCVCIDVVNQGRLLADGVDLFAPSASKRAPGAGVLGLPLAREIVAAHAGDLRYFSAPGRGTTFTVSLPCRGL